jgi:hypothetical protein
MSKSDQEWAKNYKQQHGPQCTTCKDPARKRLTALIDNVVDYPGITVSALYFRMCKIVPKFGRRIPKSAFERHFRNGHEPGWSEKRERERR